MPEINGLQQTNDLLAHQATERLFNDSMSHFGYILDTEEEDLDSIYNEDESNRPQTNRLFSDTAPTNPIADGQRTNSAPVAPESPPAPLGINVNNETNITTLFGSNIATMLNSISSYLNNVTNIDTAVTAFMNAYNNNNSPIRNTINSASNAVKTQLLIAILVSRGVMTLPQAMQNVQILSYSYANGTNTYAGGGTRYATEGGILYRDQSGTERVLTVSYRVEFLGSRYEIGSNTLASYRSNSYLANSVFWTTPVTLTSDPRNTNIISQIQQALNNPSAQNTTLNDLLDQWYTSNVINRNMSAIQLLRTIDAQVNSRYTVSSMTDMQLAQLKGQLLILASARNGWDANAVARALSMQTVTQRDQSTVVLRLSLEGNNYVANHRIANATELLARSNVSTYATITTSSYSFAQDFTISSSGDPANFINYTDASVAILINRLFQNGTLNSSMTLQQMEDAIGRYIAYNFEMRPDAAGQERWASVRETLTRGWGDSGELANLKASLTIAAIRRGNPSATHTLSVIRDSNNNRIGIAIAFTLNNTVTNVRVDDDVLAGLDSVDRMGVLASLWMRTLDQFLEDMNNPFSANGTGNRFFFRDENGYWRANPAFYDEMQRIQIVQMRFLIAQTAIYTEVDFLEKIAEDVTDQEAETEEESEDHKDLAKSRARVLNQFKAFGDAVNEAVNTTFNIATQLMNESNVTRYLDRQQEFQVRYQNIHDQYKNVTAGYETRLTVMGLIRAETLNFRAAIGYNLGQLARYQFQNLPNFGSWDSRLETGNIETPQHALMVALGLDWQTINSWSTRGTLTEQQWNAMTMDQRIQWAIIHNPNRNTSNTGLVFIENTYTVTASGETVERGSDTQSYFLVTSTGIFANIENLMVRAQNIRRIFFLTQVAFAQHLESIADQLRGRSQKTASILDTMASSIEGLYNLTANQVSQVKNASGLYARIHLEFVKQDINYNKLDQSFRQVSALGWWANIITIIVMILGAALAAVTFGASLAVAAGISIALQVVNTTAQAAASSQQYNLEINTDQLRGTNIMDIMGEWNVLPEIHENESEAQQRNRRARERFGKNYSELSPLEQMMVNGELNEQRLIDSIRDLQNHLLNLGAGRVSVNQGRMAELQNQLTNVQECMRAAYTVATAQNDVIATVAAELLEKGKFKMSSVMSLVLAAHFQLMDTFKDLAQQEVELAQETRNHNADVRERRENARIQMGSGWVGFVATLGLLVASIFTGGIALMLLPAVQGLQDWANQEYQYWHNPYNRRNISDATLLSSASYLTQSNPFDPNTQPEEHRAWNIISTSMLDAQALMLTGAQTANYSVTGVPSVGYALNNTYFANAQKKLAELMAIRMARLTVEQTLAAVITQVAVDLGATPVQVDGMALAGEVLERRYDLFGRILSLVRDLMSQKVMVRNGQLKAEQALEQARFKAIFISIPILGSSIADLTHNIIQGHRFPNAINITNFHLLVQSSSTLGMNTYGDDEYSIFQAAGSDNMYRPDNPTHASFWANPGAATSEFFNDQFGFGFRGVNWPNWANLSMRIKLLWAKRSYALKAAAAEASFMQTIAEDLGQGNRIDLSGARSNAARAIAFQRNASQTMLTDVFSQWDAYTSRFMEIQGSRMTAFLAGLNAAILIVSQIIAVVSANAGGSAPSANASGSSQAVNTTGPNPHKPNGPDRPVSREVALFMVETALRSLDEIIKLIITVVRASQMETRSQEMRNSYESQRNASVASAEAQLYRNAALRGLLRLRKELVDMITSLNERAQQALDQLINKVGNKIGEKGKAKYKEGASGAKLLLGLKNSIRAMLRGDLKSVQQEFLKYLEAKKKEIMDSRWGGHAGRTIRDAAKRVKEVYAKTFGSFKPATGKTAPPVSPKIQQPQTAAATTPVVSTATATAEALAKPPAQQGPPGDGTGATPSSPAGVHSDSPLATVDDTQPLSGQPSAAADDRSGADSPVDNQVPPLAPVLEQPPVAPVSGLPAGQSAPQSTQGPTPAPTAATAAAASDPAQTEDEMTPAQHVEEFQRAHDHFEARQVSWDQTRARYAELIGEHTDPARVDVLVSEALQANRNIAQATEAAIQSVPTMDPARAKELRMVAAESALKLELARHDIEMAKDLKIMATTLRTLDQVATKGLKGLFAKAVQSFAAQGRGDLDQIAGHMMASGVLTALSVQATVTKSMDAVLQKGAAVAQLTPEQKELFKKASGAVQTQACELMEEGRTNATGFASAIKTFFAETRGIRDRLIEQSYAQAIIHEMMLQGEEGARAAAAILSQFKDASTSIARFIFSMEESVRGNQAIVSVLQRMEAMGKGRLVAKILNPHRLGRDPGSVKNTRMMLFGDSKEVAAKKEAAGQQPIVGRIGMLGYTPAEKLKFDALSERVTATLHDRLTTKGQSFKNVGKHILYVIGQALDLRNRWLLLMKDAWHEVKPRLARTQWAAHKKEFDRDVMYSQAKALASSAAQQKFLGNSDGAGTTDPTIVDKQDKLKKDAAISILNRIASADTGTFATQKGIAINALQQFHTHNPSLFGKDVIEDYVRNKPPEFFHGPQFKQVQEVVDGALAESGALRPNFTSVQTVLQGDAYHRHLNAWVVDPTGQDSSLLAQAVDSNLASFLGLTDAPPDPDMAQLRNDLALEEMNRNPEAYKTVTTRDFAGLDALSKSGNQAAQAAKVNVELRMNQFRMDALRYLMVNNPEKFITALKFLQPGQRNGFFARVMGDKAARTDFLKALVTLSEEQRRAIEGEWLNAVKEHAGRKSMSIPKQTQQGSLQNILAQKLGIEQADLVIDALIHNPLHVLVEVEVEVEGAKTLKVSLNENFEGSIEQVLEGTPELPGPLAGDNAPARAAVVEELVRLWQGGRAEVDDAIYNQTMGTRIAAIRQGKEADALVEEVADRVGIQPLVDVSALQRDLTLAIQAEIAKIQRDIQGNTFSPTDPTDPMEEIKKRVGAAIAGVLKKHNLQDKVKEAPLMDGTPGKTGIWAALTNGVQPLTQPVQPNILIGVLGQIDRNLSAPTALDPQIRQVLADQTPNAERLKQDLQAALTKVHQAIIAHQTVTPNDPFDAHKALKDAIQPILKKYQIHGGITADTIAQLFTGGQATLDQIRDAIGRELQAGAVSLPLITANWTPITGLTTVKIDLKDALQAFLNELQVQVADQKSPADIRKELEDKLKKDPRFKAILQPDAFETISGALQEKLDKQPGLTNFEDVISEYLEGAVQMGLDASGFVGAEQYGLIDHFLGIFRESSDDRFGRTGQFMQRMEARLPGVFTGKMFGYWNSILTGLDHATVRKRTADRERIIQHMKEQSRYLSAFTATAPGTGTNALKAQIAARKKFLSTIATFLVTETPSVGQDERRERKTEQLEIVMSDPKFFWEILEQIGKDQKDDDKKTKDRSKTLRNELYKEHGWEKVRQAEGVVLRSKPTAGLDQTPGADQQLVPMPESGEGGLTRTQQKFLITISQMMRRSNWRPGTSTRQKNLKVALIDGLAAMFGADKGKDVRKAQAIGLLMLRGHDKQMGLGNRMGLLPAMHMGLDNKIWRYLVGKNKDGRMNSELLKAITVQYSKLMTIDEFLKFINTAKIELEAGRIPVLGQPEELFDFKAFAESIHLTRGDVRDAMMARIMELVKFRTPNMFNQKKKQLDKLPAKPKTADNAPVHHHRFYGSIREYAKLEADLLNLNRLTLQTELTNRLIGYYHVLSHTGEVNYEDFKAAMMKEPTAEDKTAGPLSGNTLSVPRDLYQQIRPMLRQDYLAADGYITRKNPSRVGPWDPSISFPMSPAEPEDQQAFTQIKEAIVKHIWETLRGTNKPLLITETPATTQQNPFPTPETRLSDYFTPEALRERLAAAQVSALTPAVEHFLVQHHYGVTPMSSPVDPTVGPTVGISNDPYREGAAERYAVLVESLKAALANPEIELLAIPTNWQDAKINAQQVQPPAAKVTLKAADVQKSDIQARVLMPHDFLEDWESGTLLMSEAKKTLMSKEGYADGELISKIVTNLNHLHRHMKELYTDELRISVMSPLYSGMFSANAQM